MTITSSAPAARSDVPTDRAYAIVRYATSPRLDIPAEARVRVTDVVHSEEDAAAEVLRLNALYSGTGYCFVSQVRRTEASEDETRRPPLDLGF